MKTYNFNLIMLKMQRDIFRKFGNTKLIDVWKNHGGLERNFPKNRYGMNANELADELDIEILIEEGEIKL